MAHTGEAFDGWAKAKLEAMHEDIGELKVAVKEQNGRVRILEGWKAKMVGGIALAVFVIPLLVRLSEKVW